MIVWNNRAGPVLPDLAPIRESFRRLLQRSHTITPFQHLLVTPVVPPTSPGEPKPVYVSYAWGDETDTLVDEFERSLPSTLKLIRDRRTLRPSDWISRFMKEIGRGDRVLVVIRDKYLRSRYCMLELLHLYNMSLGEREVFLQKVVPLIVGDVRISEAIDRVQYITLWKERYQKLDAALADLDHASVGPDIRSGLLSILDFQHRVSEILFWVADTLMPRGAELHSKGIEAAIDLFLHGRGGESESSGGKRDGTGSLGL